MDLSTRLANLESERKSLRGTFDIMKGDLKGLNGRFENFEVRPSLFPSAPFSCRFRPFLGLQTLRISPLGSTSCPLPDSAPALL